MRNLPTPKPGTTFEAIIATISAFGCDYKGIEVSAETLEKLRNNITEKIKVILSEFFEDPEKIIIYLGAQTLPNRKDNFGLSLLVEADNGLIHLSEAFELYYNV